MARQSTGASASAAKPGKPAKQKKTRWYAQVWQAYQMTRRQDPSVTWLMLAAFVGVAAVALIIGYLWGQVIYMAFLGIPFAALAAMFILARKAETAAYSQIEGQPGASRAALGTIRRGWSFGEEPVAVDPRTQDLIFRGIGRAGIVLVSEGPRNRATKLLDVERKRTARVLPNVPIALIQSGNDEGQVPLLKLQSSLSKLPRNLRGGEITDIRRRLDALGSAQNAMPIPKGPMPTSAKQVRRPR